MATPKKPVSKKSAPTPKATGKAVSASGVRSLQKDNVKYYDAMLDSAGDVLDYPAGHRLRKQAEALLNKYNYAAKSRIQVASGGNQKKSVRPGQSGYEGVSQKMANALSRDYNILMKAVDANEKAPVKAKAPMGRKPATPPKKK